MLNDKQREMVRDYFRGNPDATPQDIERLLGFKMDIATIIETGFLKIETADGGGGSETGTVSGGMEIKFSMTGNDGTCNLTCSIEEKAVPLRQMDGATMLRAYVLKKVMLALREEFSGILHDGDKIPAMVRDAVREIGKEYRTFVGKEGA